MGMIPLSEVSALLGLTLADTKVIVKRSDFPSTVLELPQYVYYEKSQVESWLLHLHCDTATLQRIAEMTRSMGDERRERCYLTQSEFESDDDFWESFTLEQPLDEFDNDDAAEWLATYEDQ